MIFDIAVVMATYKRPELLERCLLCLTRQTIHRRRYQVIVVSDGPDRKTETLLRRFRDEYPDLCFVFMNTDRNEGPAAARNLGWQHSRAPLVAFTDDDCLPEPSWLEAYLSVMQGQPARTVITGRVIVPKSIVPTDYEKNISGLETADFVTANCCCPISVLAEVGGFDTTYKMAWREDSDLHFNLLAHDIPIIKSTQAVVVHPVRKARWGVSLKEQRKSLYNALLFRKYPSYYKQMISKRPAWDYYIMVISVTGAVVAFGNQAPAIGAILTINWVIWLSRFIHRRLRGTSKDPSHVMEMVLTSIVIPFTSIYWTLYGSVKYKVFFL